MKHNHLLRLIEMLREHSLSTTLDNRSKGLLGNILGELKPLVDGATVDAKHLLLTSPVISAYLLERQELEQRIRELESKIPDPYDE